MFVGSWSIDESQPHRDGGVMFVIWAIDVQRLMQIAQFICEGIACVHRLIIDWMLDMHDRNNKDTFVDNRDDLSVREIKHSNTLASEDIYVWINT